MTAKTSKKWKQKGSSSKSWYIHSQHNRGCVEVSHHLLKVMLGELISNTQQLSAGVSVGEGPDAQAVRGVQLPLQEFTAGFLNLCQLQQAGSRQQSLHISLLHSHLQATKQLMSAGLKFNIELQYEA